MPTIPKRDYKPNGGRKSSGMDFLTSGIKGTEVTEMQLKWHENPCPAPPCKQAFWWASHPKPIKIKGCPKQAKQSTLAIDISREEFQVTEPPTSDFNVTSEMREVISNM